ncbi:hypothetical protein [Alkalihalobacillus sp. BA299]|uniref:hypothetical protein n=1 Tax=Alkalihalobacillus sp. BA299 TaxID=2815938 RepID=UPI001ADA6505|nr:hypothetical protein [Alkalihalobacillus sp. BA299]
MKFNTIKDLPLVIGNVLDSNNFINKSFAMTVDQIPYFIMEHRTSNNRLRVLAPVTEFPLLEVDNGVLDDCCEEEYLNELFSTLLNLHAGIEEAREFKPLCQT